MVIYRENLCQKVENLELITTDESLNYFDVLPLEIQYRIFELMPLKDQLLAAKVCKAFRQIIRDICERKYKVFNYNYLTFKYSWLLQDYEISELCYLCGRVVERLRFSTYFNMDLLKHIEWSGVRTNPMENLKFFINNNFKRNVKYFKHLQEVEVQGKFLQDQTIMELAKHCKKLKTLRLLDGDNRWLWGEHLMDLESIENLELKSCRNLDPNHLLATSQKRQLKSLNIVECEYLKDIPKVINLCQYWQNLETLRLTAFTQDQKFLSSIISLPHLKLLQFYWINFMPLNFEENFFAELKNHKNKALLLNCLKFENDRYYLEDESLQQWTPEKYAIMRENVCINGQAWQWSNEDFDKILTCFKEFKNLHTLTFQYCRLLDYNQLQQLGLSLSNLKFISIYGCPKAEDKLFEKEWLLKENQQDFTPKCQLSFDSFLTLKEVLVRTTKEFSFKYSFKTLFLFSEPLR